MAERVPFLNTAHSGYHHRERPTEDEELTRVGPGTPCGEYLRRFWQPVILSEELRDLPRRLRILGEDLVVFRDRSGAVGLLELHCPHRGTSLEFGLISEKGIRCCYHGWLFDVDGTILVFRVNQRIHDAVRMCNTGPWLGDGAMAQQVCVVLSTAERERLAGIVANRNRPRKHVERARIVLASADRHSPQRVAQSIGVSRPTVWRWQQRFAESGVDGLLRDKTRKPGKPPIAAETTARVVALTCTEPPHQATHWTGRAMANVIGISLGSVQRIWRAHKLQPHRLRTFKRSRDPSFAAKLTDIVGLYVDPPAHAVVLSLDEKSQIQALDRTQPGLPIKPGRCQTMTHDYKRHGTTTLFAALSVLDGTVIGRCMQRHRHLEFIRFLNAVERQVAADGPIHVVLDNYATHKHPKVLAWLARHPRWTFHFTPTSASWLNAVENFFSKMTRQRIRRGVFRSIADLQAAINAYLVEHNASPKPFVWTKSAEAILAKLDRLPVTSL